jgi:hypothetical protein
MKAYLAKCAEEAKIAKAAAKNLVEATTRAADDDEKEEEEVENEDEKEGDTTDDDEKEVLHLTLGHCSLICTYTLSGSDREHGSSFLLTH